MKKSLTYLVLVALFCFAATCSIAQQKQSEKTDWGLVPAPASLKKTGQNFALSSATTIVADDKNKALGQFVADYIQQSYQFAPKLAAKSPASGNIIELLVDPAVGKEEAYQLIVADNKITVKGASDKGLFWGIQSLNQLIYPGKASNNQVSIPGVEISDEPAFGWRGMHLDVTRHFYPVEFVKRMLDLMAMHKLNTFHWHLTDDQGWRIEIKKYPKLTEVSAWRDETVVGHMSEHPYRFDGKRHGGFYTQEQIKEVIDYARSRYITVVPEIEMPGHAVAVLSAYPELSCTGGPFETMKLWGVSDDVFCAGKEKTFHFLEDVLGEVAALFPGEYIHVGGDECPKVRWEKCPDCQRRIRKEGLHDEHELQSYFIKRMEKFLATKNKKLIGWDEILEGGLPERASVMSWRGIKGGIEAVKQGHDVVMSPSSHCYFDHYQGSREMEPVAIAGLTTLEKVYNFNPVPAELNEQQKKHILGAQANLWTEYITTQEHVEYMLFPRLSALSEVLRTPKGNRNWDSFKRNMDSQYARLDQKKVNYRISPPAGFKTDNKFTTDKTTVTFDSDIPGAVIRYTLDGSEPTANSTLYTGPFSLSLGNKKIVKAKTFMPGGRASGTSTGTFEKVALLKATDAKNLSKGITVKQYNTAVTSAKEVMEFQKPDTVLVMNSFKIPKKNTSDWFGLDFNGFVSIPDDGIYTFYVNCNDGALLYIDDKLVVDNDGYKYGAEKSGEIGLKKGYHSIRLVFFEAKFGPELDVKIEGKGMTKKEIPASMLFTNQKGTSLSGL